jgi:hypothetical protein
VIVPLAAAGVTTWAGMKTKVATACDNQELVQPFTQFGDSGSYTFAPNGGFENGKTGWALTGAASVVNGNESYFVHGTGDSKSLSLPAGASATSPAICFGTLYPWSRLFVNGPSGGSLKVDLLYVDDGGTGRSATLATLTGAGNWQLSSKLVAPSFLVSLFSKLGYTAPSGERFSAVAYRFTASGGTWKIDDLYVDPFKFR